MIDWLPCDASFFRGKDGRRRVEQESFLLSRCLPDELVQNKLLCSRELGSSSFRTMYYSLEE
jgi:hypothetical protein